LLRQLSGGGPGAKLARGTATAFAVSAAGTLIVFANQILLARVLGADAYGQYIYALTWVGLLVILSNAGFNTAAVRFAAEYSGSGELGLLRGFLRLSFRIVLLVSVSIAVITAFVVLLLKAGISEDLARVLWVACLLIPVWALLELRSASLRGLKRILAAQGVPQVLRPLLFAVGILGVYFLRSQGVEASTAVVANIGATVVSLALVHALLQSSLRDKLADNLQSRPREWLAVSLPLLMMAGFGVVLRSSDTLMLGFLRDTTEAGVYAVASRVAMFVPFMLTAVNTMAAPMIAEYYAAGDRRRLRKTLVVGAWAALLFGIVVGMVLFAMGRQVLSAFGVEFVAGYLPMLILVGGQLVNCLAGSVSYLMTMTGRQNQAAKILGGSAVANVALNALLIPSFGALGAALATATSTVAWNVGMLWAVARQIGVNPTIFQPKA
jgi:O-antigen/teichoic acid export membrane protein